MGRGSWWGLRLAGAAITTVIVAASAGAGAPVAAQQLHRWCPEPEARQFDFWIGEWDVLNRNSPPGSDDWVATGSATDRVYAVLDGCAIVEHWRGYAFPSAGHIVGFSVRAWDPAGERWELALLWPVAGPPRFGNPSGRFADGRGVFYNRFVNPNGDSVTTSLAFYDITHDSFVWSNGVSTDGGESWTSSWIMEFSRRPATASGLLNGPSMNTDHCPGTEHRAFDRYLGEWAGTRTGSGGDSTAIRVELVRILEGCAIMQRTRAADGAWEAFAVRAFEPGAGRWVEYAVGSHRRTLHRREADGPTADEVMVFTDAEPVDGLYVRTRWTFGGGALGWVEEQATSPTGPWRLSATTTLAGRVGVGNAPK